MYVPSYVSLAGFASVFTLPWRVSELQLGVFFWRKVSFHEPFMKVSFHEPCPFLLDKERGKFWTKLLALAIQVLSFPGLWWAFGESRYPNVAVEKKKEAKIPKLQNLASDLGHWNHEKKEMVPIIFIFYEERGTLIPVTDWGEKNIFTANWWTLKKKSSHGSTWESLLAGQE